MENSLHHLESRWHHEISFKTQLAALFAVLGMQLGIAQTKTIDTSTTEVTTQTEVVQQGEDPVKDLMAKFNITAVADIKMMDFRDMVAMLRDAYTISSGDQNLTNEVKKIITRLENCIQWEDPSFDIASLKAPSWSDQISESEKERIISKQQQLAQKNEEIKSKQKIDQQIQNQVTTLKTNINKWKDQVATLTPEERQIQNQVATLNTNINKWKEEIITLDKKIEQLTNKVQAAQKVAQSLVTKE
jgi:hypothetical protein